MSRNAWSAIERQQLRNDALRDQEKTEREANKEDFLTPLQRKDLDQAIDMIESEIARARRYFARSDFKAAKKELDDLLANVRAWDRGQYSPGNHFAESSVLVWPEAKP